MISIVHTTFSYQHEHVLVTIGWADGMLWRLRLETFDAVPLSLQVARALFRDLREHALPCKAHTARMQARALLFGSYSLDVWMRAAHQAELDTKKGKR